MRILYFRFPVMIDHDACCCVRPRKKLFVCKCFFVIPDRECDLWFRGNGLIGARIRCGREHSDSECNQKKNRETFHNTTSIANFFLPDKKNPAPPLKGRDYAKVKEKLWRCI